MESASLLVAARILGFVGALAMFPRTLVSRWAVFAFGLALMLYAPLFHPQLSRDGGADADIARRMVALEALGELTSRLSVRAALGEMFIGLFVGVCVSGTVYGFTLFSRLLRSRLFPGRAYQEQSYRPLELFLLLLFLAHIAFRGDYIGKLFLVFVSSLLSVDLGSGFSFFEGPGAGGSVSTLVDIGSSALQFGLLLTMPFFVVSFLLDLIQIVLQRWAPDLGPGTFATVRIPLLLGLLSYSIYSLREESEKGIRRSLRTTAKNLSVDTIRSGGQK